MEWRFEWCYFHFHLANSNDYHVDNSLVTEDSTASNGWMIVNIELKWVWMEAVRALSRNLRRGTKGKDENPRTGYSVMLLFAVHNYEVYRACVLQWRDIPAISHNCFI
jgi:hypothetical protein